MAEFNDPTILMALDEYYDKCVVPKPKIPKSYAGLGLLNQHNKKNRKSGHLQSYKDNDGANEEDDDEEELDRSISPTEQLDYEMSDFNQMYEDANGTVNEISLTARSGDTTAAEPPRNSAQWRIQSNNMNRPLGAAPLVPKHLPQRSNLNGRSSRNGRNNNNNNWPQQNRNRGNNNNNNNNRNQQQQQQHQLPVHLRLGYVRRGPNQNQQSEMRRAYNMFANNTADNGYNNKLNANQQPQQVLMKIKDQFRNDGLTHLNLGQQFASAQGNNWATINSFTALVNSANSQAINRPPLAPYFQGMAAVNNCQVNQNNFNSYAQSANINQPAAASIGIDNSLEASRELAAPRENRSLADLLHIDRSNIKHINAFEVAKNAIYMLNTVVHKPILDADVQKKLGSMQASKDEMNVPSGEGLDMSIQPVTTCTSMYQRFK